MLEIPKDKIRIDLLLVKNQITESREKAKALIMAGVVEVDGKRVDKPGSLIHSAAKITVKNPYPPYVSRGGLKLEAALEHFSINVKGLVLLDVGASTGGFTDCLLQNGSERIFAVDVGYGQLHWKLRQDKRVEVLERQNIRYLTPEEIHQDIDGAVIDVSFISLKLVIPVVSKIVKENGFIVALIKPQFEVGRTQVGKGGVVRDPKLHEEVIVQLSKFFKNHEWNIVGHIPSPILGPKGNREFLIYMKR